MSDVCLILAAGESTRWDGKNVGKHFVRIDGEKLILRTMRQFKKFEPLMITRNQANAEAYKTTCHTLLSTSRLWKDRTIILLGDVMFTKDAVRKIIKCDEGFCVFGDTVDIFALSFTNYFHKLLEAALKESSGRLHEVEWLCKNHELIDDETQDFDCMHDYREFQAGRTKNYLLRKKRANHG